ncbi:gustatory receptor for sugar taste 64e-like [Thrips palmi]|uniref:Gustatory receptor for sugar taste 64e-like n=1 Tax=Thrips palmi TaxID=161013 RepID=A0A6P8YER3_THRPL|nr:gustatory receptor for sugar taste 64e-like [Thrips palmi]
MAISGLSQDGYLSLIGDLAAHGVAISIAVTYLRLARRWSSFATVFERAEKVRAVGDRYPPLLGRDMKRLTVALFCLMIVDYTFDRVSLFSQTLASYPSVQDLFEDSLAKPPLSEVVSTVFFQATATLLAFLYVFNDLFIMLVSLYVSRRVQNLNSHLHPSLTKEKSNVFWEEARRSYDELSKLIKEIDAFVNTNVFLSFTQNLFFICFQLYYFLSLSQDSFMRKLFRIYSFAYIIGRTYAVALLAARINDHSKVSRTLLFSVSSRSYCRQVQRFIQQATLEEMALSGCHLFRVTRSFILTVAGTIATYEVVLLQMQK